VRSSRSRVSATLSTEAAPPPPFARVVFMDVSRSARSLNTIRTKGRTICAKGNRFRNELSSSAQPSGRSCSISPAVSACVYCCSGFGLQSAISRGRGVGFTRQQMFQKPKRETQLGIGGASPKLVFKLASLLTPTPKSGCLLLARFWLQVVHRVRRSRRINRLPSLCAPLMSGTIIKIEYIRRIHARSASLS